MSTIDDPSYTGSSMTELLAVAEASELIALADELLATHGDPTLVIAPEIGLVMMEVREPVCEERFHLGEVVVTRAEVVIAGHTGWAMRLGTDRVATLAAAICEAIGSSDLADRHLVHRLCERTARHHEAKLATEWEQLAATEVRFEEME
jgi:alpha-D-ribose 1-methylphosphonate 5-triphosphate synthase subunit PhnG